MTVFGRPGFRFSAGPLADGGTPEIFLSADRRIILKTYVRDGTMAVMSYQGKERCAVHAE